MRILTTLIQADAGRAEVAGFDVTGQPQRVRARIGVTGQRAIMDVRDGLGRCRHRAARQEPAVR
jgi:ABC-2 type transport system ATP-binding protein